MAAKSQLHKDDAILSNLNDIQYPSELRAKKSATPVLPQQHSDLTGLQSTYPLQPTASQTSPVLANPNVRLSQSFAATGRSMDDITPPRGLCLLTSLYVNHKGEKTWSMHPKIISSGIYHVTWSSIVMLGEYEEGNGKAGPGRTWNLIGARSSTSTIALGCNEVPARES